MTDFSGIYFDRYHILASLGEGGMASVYKAYDTRLERDVAVKIIRIDMFIPAVLQDVLKRFEREAKSLAKLSHPNIVGIIDYGEHEGVPYLVMVYLPGGTLKDRLQGRPLTWQESFHLLLPIARALQFSHQQGIIHRDVKPSNILITLSGEPMLSDFGIAKILEGEGATTLTGTGVGIGTPEYMAPEQWVGHASPQSDQYSLGVVLYEMVTGRKPYTADTPAALLLKQANDPLPRPRQIVPDLPEKVEKIILKVLAKKSENRYASMGEFITALEDQLSGHTKLKQPVLPTEKPKAEESLSPELVVSSENMQDRDQPTQVARRSEVEKARLEELARQKAASEEKARREAEEHLRQDAEIKARQAAEEQSRREAREREERAAVQPVAEISQSQPAVEPTLVGGEGGPAEQLVSQVNSLGTGEQVLAYTLQERMPRPKIPGWAWAVVGVVVLGITFGAVFLLGGNHATQKLPIETPRPTVQTMENFALQPVQSNTPTLVPITPTLIPTLTGTPVPAVTVYTGNVQLNANVRSGPGTNYPVLQVYTAGTKVQIIGRNHAEDWLVLALPENRQGWIAVGLLQVDFDIKTLDEIIAPPAPTLEPTQGSNQGGSQPHPVGTLAPP
jgi:serine/threonine protein kinase